MRSITCTFLINFRLTIGLQLDTVDSHLPEDENIHSDQDILLSSLPGASIIDQSSPSPYHRFQRITHLIIKQTLLTLKLVIRYVLTVSYSFS